MHGMAWHSLPSAIYIISYDTISPPRRYPGTNYLYSYSARLRKSGGNHCGVGVYQYVSVIFPDIDAWAADTDGRGEFPPPIPPRTPALILSLMF